MANAQSGSGLSVEIGTWVESDTPKKNGQGMRKVWVSGGDGDKLSVISRTDGKADRHLITLPVGTPEDRASTRAALGLALTGMDALDKPTPVSAAKPAAEPKPPTSDAVTKARAAVGNPASTPKVTAPAPAPKTAAAFDWATLVGQ